MQSTSERDSFGLVITHWGEGAAHDFAGQPIYLPEYGVGSIGRCNIFGSTSEPRR